MSIPGKWKRNVPGYPKEQESRIYVDHPVVHVRKCKVKYPQGNICIDFLWKLVYRSAAISAIPLNASNLSPKPVWLPGLGIASHDVCLWA